MMNTTLEYRLTFTDGTEYVSPELKCTVREVWQRIQLARLDAQAVAVVHGKTIVGFELLQGLD